jgi:hypothetical protein
MMCVKKVQLQLAAQYNNILDINRLVLTQCQQPLFFSTILLELAADFEKS